MAEHDTPPTPSDPPAHSTSGDLKRSKAELLRALAKAVGIVSLSLIPALATYIDAKTKAATALSAASSEKATNDIAYAKLVERLNKMELDMRKMSVEVAIARELGQIRIGVPMGPPIPTSTIGTSVDEALSNLRSPVPKLSAERPTPTKEDVKAAQQTFEKAY